MPEDEWYTKKTWTSEDQEEFFRRLERCRAYNKPQLVLAQAKALAGTGETQAIASALKLLGMAVKEWPGDILAAWMHWERGKCFLALGETPRAIEAYRDTLQVQRQRPNVLTQAPLDFGWLVATTPLPELYDEVLGAMEEFPSDTLPIQRYRTDVICALILADRGQMGEARDCARCALSEADAVHSGFRYHPDFGLVEPPDEKVLQNLREIAEED